MKSISDVTDFMRKVLGNSAGDIFGVYLDDFICYVKYCAMTDSEDEIENNQMQEQFAGMIQSAIMQAFDVYLKENYPTDSGLSEINIGYDIVYDRDMKEMEEFRSIRDKYDKIIELLMRKALKIFANGQELAAKIGTRSMQRPGGRREVANVEPKNEAWEPYEIGSPSQPARDYRKNPPLEIVDIEIIRLERKLPNLSQQEGERLSFLYRLCRNKTAVT